MNPNIPRVVAYIDFAIAAGIAIWGLILATYWLHPMPGDSHGGLMGVFPGLLLLLLAFLTYTAGKLLLQKHVWGWIAHTLVSLLIIGLAVALAAS